VDGIGVNIDVGSIGDDIDVGGIGWFCSKHYHAFEDKLHFVVIFLSVESINGEELVLGRFSGLVKADFVHNKPFEDLFVRILVGQDRLRKKVIETLFGVFLPPRSRSSSNPPISKPIVLGRRKDGISQAGRENIRLNVVPPDEPQVAIGQFIICM